MATNSPNGLSDPSTRPPVAKPFRFLCFLVSGLVLLRASFGFGLLPDWDGLKHLAAAQWILEHNMNPFPDEIAYGHPPLFYMMLAAGLSVPIASLWVLHALMALTALFAGYYTLRLGTQFGGERCGLLASCLMVLSPLFAAELETFHAELLCAASLAATLVYYFERRWGAYCVAAVILLLTKETGVAAILVLTVYHFVKRGERDHLIKILLPLFAFGFWMLGNRVFNGWWFLPRVGQSLHHVLLDDMLPSASAAVPSLFWWTFGACGTWMLTGSALLIAGWLCWRRAESLTSGTVLLAAMIIVHLTVLALYAGRMALPRWTVDVAPLTFCLIANPIAEATQRQRHLLPLIIGCFGIAWALGPPMVSPEERDALNLNHRDRIEVNRQLAAYIETSHPSARILTWWPLTQILSDASLGYVRSPLNVVSIKLVGPEFHWVDRETCAISDAAFHVDEQVDFDLVASGDMIASMTIHQRILSPLRLKVLKSFNIGHIGAGVSANRTYEFPQNKKF